MQKKYALIGAAGYIAPRHMDAIARNNGDLVAAYDLTDSVGRLDAHFPNAQFFVNFERFAAYLDKLKKQGRGADMVSICSPNYMHKSHIQFALRDGMDAICEKPLVLDPEDIDDLVELEKATGRKVNTILQLRLHPAIVKLRETVQADTTGTIYDAELTYVTRRGQWYYESWKGDVSRSGGIASNIGVHFFDTLSFVFGPLKRNVVHHRAMDCAAGYLEFERARVRWFLSINGRDKDEGEGFARRCLDIPGVGFYDFSKGFEDLHAVSYAEIVNGRGFPLTEVRPSIAAVARIRDAAIERGIGSEHPMVARVLADKDRYRDGYPV